MRKLFAALAFLFCVMACDNKADLDAEKKQNQDNGRVINMLSADIPADGTADYSAHISEVFSNLGAGSKVLFFPKGLYRLEKALSINRDSLTILGEKGTEFLVKESFIVDGSCDSILYCKMSSGHNGILEIKGSHNVVQHNSFILNLSQDQLRDKSPDFGVISISGDENVFYSDTISCNWQRILSNPVTISIRSGSSNRLIDCLITNQESERVIVAPQSTIIESCVEDEGKIFYFDKPAGQDEEGQEEEDPDPDVIKILAIGNSFSEDVVEQNLYQLFLDAGIRTVIGNMYIGGCILQTHWVNAENDLPHYSYRKVQNGYKTVSASCSISHALKDEYWDYISFQQGSGLYGYYDSYFPYLPNLIGYVKEKGRNKNVKIILHSTWAAAASSTHSHFQQYYQCDQQYMYEMIVATAQELLATEGLQIDVLCNSTDAIQNGRTSTIGDNFTREDGWHLNDYGRFTAACLWYEKISEIDVTTNGYKPAAFSDDDARLCKLAAHMAALHPFQVTNIE